MPARLFWSAVALLLGAAVLLLLIGTRTEPIVVATNLERLPDVIAELKGEEDRFSASVYRALDADLHLYRHYRNDENRVDLYVGYYGTGKGGRSAHNPMSCLPGAGWAILRDEAVDLDVPGERSRQIRSIVASRDGQYVTLFHWYQTNRSEITADGIMQNLIRFKNRLLHNRGDGAYVQVSVFSGRDRLAEAGRIGLGFAGQVKRMLPDYWPEERVGG